MNDIAWDATTLEAELARAGRTMQALQLHGVWPAGLRSAMPDVVRELGESYGWDGGRARPACPLPGEIAAMDRALAWLQLIPGDRWVLRRIVAARSITDAAGRPAYSWRKIGALLGCSHMAVSRWHAQGIALILKGL